MSFVREILIAEIAKLPETEVAVLLSGGIDSLACALAAQELGKKVTAYSFMLDGRMSSDFSRARHHASIFGFDFKPVFLPRDLETLKSDLLYLADMGARKKTDFECAWPVFRAFREVEQPAIITGHAADGHFCISKKGMLHWKDRIDEFRRNLFGNPRYAQGPLLREEARRLGKSICLPFLAPEMHQAFLGRSWEEVNKPKQKQPILDAYPEAFRRIAVKPHINLQLGDSGIADHFSILVPSDWNVSGAKTPRAIYNRLGKEAAERNGPAEAGPDLSEDDED